MFAAQPFAFDLNKSQNEESKIASSPMPNNTKQSFTMEEQVRLTKEPFNFLMKNTAGKEIRAKLIEAFNIWLKVSDDTSAVVRNVTQKLHNASLLIDDIEDNSKLRRGKPCAHLIYGVPATINCANYVYFEALKDLQQLQSMEAITVFMDELLNLHRGQAMDIYWRDNVVCPTEEQYMEMVQNKTGGLFRLAVGLMQSKSENKSNFSPLVNKLASLFQILDDYLNLESPKYHTNKSFAEDLTEGKFSFPIIHSIQQSKFDSRLLNIVRQKPSDHNVKIYAIDIMRETNSFTYTIDALRILEKQVLEEINSLGGNDMLTAIVKALMAEIDTIPAVKQQQQAASN